MIKNKFYEAPESEPIFVRIEDNLLASDFKATKLNEGNTTWWDDEEE